MGVVKKVKREMRHGNRHSSNCIPLNKVHNEGNRFLWGRRRRELIGFTIL
jgi:hypothetical protein